MKQKDPQDRGQGPPAKELPFRVLLALYPAKFRRRYGPELVEASRQAWNDSARNPTTRLRRRGALAVDLVTTGWILWKRRLSAPSKDRIPPKNRRRRQERFPMNSVFQDLKFGCRSLTKDRSYTFVAVLSLALGIGANLAIFTLYDALLLRSLPVDQPEQLVSVHGQRSGERFSISFPIFEEFERRQDIFAGIFADAGPQLSATYYRGRPLSEVHIDPVTGGFFETLGVKPFIGRLLTPSDDVRVGVGEAPAAVLNHRFWKRQFGADPSVLGEVLEISGDLDRKSFVIVGVAPPEFFGTALNWLPDIWLPMRQSVPEGNLNWRTGNFFHVMARLKPDQDRRHAQVGAGLLFKSLVAQERESGLNSLLENGQSADELALELRPAANGFEALRRAFSRPLNILMVLVLLVLLIACFNVGGLALARSTAKEIEIGTRITLGAGRLRLVRQLIVEGLMLAAAGCGLGLLLAQLTNRTLIALFVEGPNSELLALRTDWRLAAFAVGVSVLTALFFSLAPALQTSNISPMQAIRGGGDRLQPHRLRRVLVAGQFAISLLLISAATLLAGSLRELAQVELGFVKDDVLTIDFKFNTNSLSEEERRDLANRIAERLGEIPGVSSAGTAWLRLFGLSNMQASLRIEDYPPSLEKEVDVRLNMITPGYLESLGTPLVKGRVFGRADRRGAPRVAIVSRTFVERFWPNDEPLGKWINLGEEEEERAEVVGVAGDSKWNDLRAEVEPMFYLPIAQWSVPVRTAALKTPRDLASLRPEVEKALREIDPDMLIRGVAPLAEHVDRSLRRERALTKLSTVFGVLGLFMAAVGLYGVMAYSVGRRTREIGIRMAVGANRAQVLKMVVSESLRLAGIGLALGLPLVWAVGGALQSFLFELTPTNPGAIAAAVLILLFVALAATVLPARRASRIEPQQALRHV